MAQSLETLKGFSVEFDSRRRNVFFQVGPGCCSRNHNNIRRPMKEPCERDLRLGNMQALCDFRQRTAGRCKRSSRFHRVGTQGAVGDEQNPLSVTELDDRVALAVCDAIPILHGRDRSDGKSLFDPGQRDIAKPDSPDLSLFLQSGKPGNGIR